MPTSIYVQVDVFGSHSSTVFESLIPSCVFKIIICKKLKTILKTSLDHSVAQCLAVSEHKN